MKYIGPQEQGIILQNIVTADVRNKDWTVTILESSSVELLYFVTFKFMDRVWEKEFFINHLKDLGSWDVAIYLSAIICRQLDKYRDEMGADYLTQLLHENL